MNYGLTLPLESVPFSEHPRHLPELADLGYTDLWTSETGGYDAFSPLVMAAAVAPQLRLGTAIVPTFTRGPAVLAMHAAALADAAPGRVALGIGSSSPTAVEDWNGRSFDRPYAHVRDTLQFLRRALAGELIDEEFETFRVRRFRLLKVPEQPPRLFVAALRERMLRLAAREADGVCLGLITADDVKIAVAILADEARKANRPMPEVVMRVSVYPTEDAASARRIIRSGLAMYLNVPTYAALHEWLGRGEMLKPLHDAFSRRDRKAAHAAVPDSLVDELSVHGSPAACRAHIQRFVDAGVTTPILQVVPFGDDPLDSVRAVAPVRGTT